MKIMYESINVENIMYQSINVENIMYESINVENVMNYEGYIHLSTKGINIKKECDELWLTSFGKNTSNFKIAL